VLVDQAVEKAGSLQSLLRQAEVAIEDLREASRTNAMVRPNVVEFPQTELAVLDDESDEEDGDEDVARAA